jgi:predicted RNA-binding Zn-ribbon protein involved in translation (DUF1610 family)
MAKTYYVQSQSEFPNWKQPCPVCGAKYPQPAISARKDGTASWCKSCGTNWKIADAPQGIPTTNEQSNRIDHLAELHVKVDELVTAMVSLTTEVREVLKEIGHE